MSPGVENPEFQNLGSVGSAVTRKFGLKCKFRRKSGASMRLTRKSDYKTGILDARNVLEGYLA